MPALSEPKHEWMAEYERFIAENSCPIRSFEFIRFEGSDLEDAKRHFAEQGCAPDDPISTWLDGQDSTAGYRCSKEVFPHLTVDEIAQCEENRRMAVRILSSVGDRMAFDVFLKNLPRKSNA